MKISRQVGTASEILQLFVQDATVTTGAGLANVIGSSVSYSWFRNNQSAVSTGTASTAGAMGVYSTSAWVQISSSNALGWYQFGAPNGAFTSGDVSGIHFYGAPSMAALPVEIELTKTDNQTYTSSQSIGNVLAQVSSNLYRIYSQNAVTSASGELRVSTQALATTTNANVLQVYSSAVVTSAGGQLLVSTQALATTTNSNLLQIYGNQVVTSAAGQLRVSTQTMVNPDNTGIANISSAVLNPMTESYRDNSSTGTMAQLMYEMISHMGEVVITGTTKTLNNLTHTTAVETFQLDSSTSPSTITRIT